MRAKAVRLVKWSAILLAVILLTVLVVRAYDSQRGPPLELWHTYVPHEMTAAEIGKADWTQYLAAEQKIFGEVRAEVTDKLDPESREPGNRYFAGSPIYPGNFAHGLEPLVRPGARRRARRRRGAAARAHRLAVQPAGTSRGATATTATSRSRSGCPATAPCRAA